MPIGAAADGFAYDNEKPRHEVEVDSFAIGRLPVTNADWLAFIEAGGYARRRWWSPAGWEWRQREGIERPLHWIDDARERRLDGVHEFQPGARRRARLLV